MAVARGGSGGGGAWPLTITLSTCEVYLIINSWHPCPPEANSLRQETDTQTNDHKSACHDL